MSITKQKKLSIYLTKTLHPKQLIFYFHFLVNFLNLYINQGTPPMASKGPEAGERTEPLLPGVRGSVPLPTPQPHTLASPAGRQDSHPVCGTPYSRPGTHSYQASLTDAADSRAAEPAKPPSSLNSVFTGDTNDTLGSEDHAHP